MKRLTIQLAMAVCVTFYAAQEAYAQPASTPMGTHSPAAARSIIEARSRNALNVLKLPHMSRLSNYVHPTRGLRFSPYVSADNSDRVFSRNQVRYLGNSTQPYHWGEADGTGDDILLTWRNYYRRFVYDRNFVAAPKVLYNTAISRGNTTTNLNARYPGAIFVEYHFPGTDAMNFMNWKSLWLIWQRSGTTWYLSGIAHDEWTT
jgi:hypothetical protein